MYTKNSRYKYYLLLIDSLLQVHTLQPTCQSQVVSDGTADFSTDDYGKNISNSAMEISLLE